MSTVQSAAMKLTNLVGMPSHSSLGLSGPRPHGNASEWRPARKSGLDSPSALLRCQIPPGSWLPLLLHGMAQPARWPPAAVVAGYLGHGWWLQAAAAQDQGDRSLPQLVRLARCCRHLVQDRLAQQAPEHIC